MRGRVALALSALLCACAPSAPTKFGVNLTIDYRELDAATLSALDRTRIRVRGDETFDDESLKPSAIRAGQARLRYETTLSSGRLDFIVDALDVDGASLAHARTQASLMSGRATSITLTLAPAPTDGAACDDALDCPNTTACLDGVCCVETSCPTCRACGQSGRCDVTITERIDGDSCHGLSACDATGECNLHRTACTSASECETGFCVDGVCCESACDGACQTCDALDAPGLCRPVRFALDDHCTIDASGAAMCDADATCQHPHLLMDLNTTAGSAPAEFTRIADGRVFFSADDGIAGRELWVTDGTASGTHRFVDINAGAGSSAPSDLTPYQGGLLFVAAKGTGTANRSLWFTDGTPAGTALVWNTGAFNENPNQLRMLGDKVYFVAFNSPASVGRELHVYDGTAVTVAVDVNPGLSGSNITGMTIFDQRLFFSAQVGTDGQEVYSSDGTVAGTQLLREIGAGMIDAVPSNFYVWNDRLLFSARDNSNNVEPYISDGTTAGTSMVLAQGINGPEEINPPTVNGSLTGYAPSFTPFGGNLYFFAVTAASTERNIERLTPIDGLAHRVHTFATANRDPRELLVFDGALYFTANASSGTNRSLWTSDGNNFGTVLSFSASADSVTQNLSVFPVSGVGDFLFFSANVSAGMPELHVLAAQGQTPVVACPASAPCPSPSKITVIDGRAYFTANPDGLGDELYVFP